MITFEHTGWEVTTADGIETYTKDLSLVEVVARWDPAASLGTITVEGIGTRYAAGMDSFRDAQAFWVAANLVADTAAAPIAVAGHVIGTIGVDPGDYLEAELDITLDDGREIGLTLVEHQASELTSALYRLDKHVWDEQREEEEDDPYEGVDHGAYTDVLPHVTAAETLTVVEVVTTRFGVDRSDISVSGGGAWITVHDDEVRGRHQEIGDAIGPKWRCGTDEERLTIEYYPKGQFV